MYLSQKQTLGDWLGKLWDIYKMEYMFSINLKILENAHKKW